MKNKVLIIFILLLSLSSCCNYMPSDLMLIVEGTAPKNDECELHLQLNGKDISTIEPVKGEFTASFFVTFCVNEYTIIATCDGNNTYTNKFIFPNEDNANEVYNLGNIKP